MKTITQEQKDQLAKHIANKPIDYIELYNELYDHYASAYETGEKNFEETLEQLDEHFHFQKVKRINDNLLKKTKKSVNDIYWNEFKNFWRWPQILSTLGILFLAILLMGFIPVKSIVWYFLVPILALNVGLLIYGSILMYTKKRGKKRFKSAHFNATQHYLSLPTTIFNLTIFLPVLVLEPGKPTISIFETYPIIVLLLLMLFFTSVYIGMKVFRTKIKVQYL
ncbi:hypothetical protein [Marivirga harenae]|uniref:hypothetical protein n=1 Tax=Marivirga harenae TaxID=2010992 RepID=UPI0026DEA6EB|nr:hypothetical protein [Marivirga harenae]WKV11679.1 hypothetical protein Q3Y49_15865 [Marivirga harenae]|tara:strand:+ start:185827 stop:186495 length:669 start_codon:yes stop_codon:yes gene_type:complete